MNKYLIFFITCVAVAGLLIASKKWLMQEESSTHDHFHEVRHQFVVAEANRLLGFDLVDPGQSPPDIRESVLRGYRLLMNTPMYAPRYARDFLSCTSCHFSEGDTLGGRNNGLSLVGVTAVYPRFSDRANRFITLGERINYCFERSMNGSPLPLDSQEMEDILHYLAWISKEVQSLKSIPWLGINPLKSEHRPSPEEGSKIYQKFCASCHKEEGQGGGILPGLGKTIPPLWGENSFNRGAGMNHLPLFAAFVYWNMPYQNSVLTEEEALDVAAFVLQQPRPDSPKIVPVP